MVSILDKAKNTIKEYSLLNQGDHVIVACSGGPDSVALFHILNEIRGEYKLCLYLAHFNHGIRQDAQEDERFVREIAYKAGVKFFSTQEDCLRLKKEWKISLEGAARRARLNFLIHQADILNVNKIALGHNADDQAETILMRIIRGTGGKGMGGISPSRLMKDKYFIRPIINCNREEILEYLQSKNIGYRVDNTNFQRSCTRNKIRLDLIPYIKKNINPSIINTLIRSAKIFQEEEDAIKWYIENRIKEIKCANMFIKGYDSKIGWKSILQKRIEDSNTPLGLSIDDLKSLPTGFQRRLIIACLSDLFYGGDTQRLSFTHIEAVLKLIKGEKGLKEVILPGDIKLYKGYGHLFACPVDTSRCDAKGVKTTENNRIRDHSFDLELNIPGITYSEFFDLTLRATLLDKTKIKQIPRNPLIALFDYDKMGQPIKLRVRRPGDLFHPLGLKGKKSLKDFFIDEKVLKTLRDFWPLLVNESDIYWVIGMRIGHPYRITEQTKKVLRIDIE